MNYNQYQGPNNPTATHLNMAMNGQSNTQPPSDSQRTATASPAGPPGSTPQSAHQPMRRRRPQQTNPLVPNRRPPQRPKHQQQPPRQPPKPNGQINPMSTTRLPTQLTKPMTPVEQPIESLPVYTSSKASVEGLRHHVLRFHPPPVRPIVDIYDEAEFTPPLRLHRRDPRAPAVGAVVAEDIEEDKDNPIDDKDRERMEILKEERKRIREENQAQIAPTQKKNRPAAFQKKTEQVYRKDDTPQARKKSQLRYEESLPWHLEDFDNKNTWVGTYEAALSEHYVMLIRDQTGFRLIPVEKWYRFTSKQRGKTWTAEQADAAFQAKSKAPRWFVAAEQRDAEKKMQQREHRLTRKLHLGATDTKRQRGDDEGMGEVEDVGEMDYNAEEDFADDEEGVNGLFEGDDEDTKMASDKIKKEQMGANVFELRDEKDVWKQEEKEQKDAEERKKLEKQMRKALLKREKNYDYEDSDGNPYSDSSESLDSEEERKVEEEQKKEEEKKNKSKEKEKEKEAEKPKQTASGASSKGTTTPSGRTKTTDPLKKSNLLGKRPGSPNLSEASGNESTRKKAKKQHAQSQQNDAPGSFKPNTKINKIRGGAGSGSESEMTEGGRNKKLKLRLGQSPNGTPSGSRAGSPVAPGASPTLSASGTSRAPGASPTAASPGSKVTMESILLGIPPEGNTMNEVLIVFKKHFNIKESKDQFMALIKKLCRVEKNTKMIYLRGT